MLELFPQGFEEIEHPDGTELVAYTDAAGEELLWDAFGTADGHDVAVGWEDAWRRFHRPVRVGPLWVGPPWERPPSDVNAVVIDPGRAFGTGTHESTALCLEALARLAEGGPLGRVADVGTGSGAVAVALALRAPAAEVWASDVDPTAVELTSANAARHGVGDRVHAVAGDVLGPVPRPLDLAVANLPYLPARLARDRAYAEYLREPHAAVFAPGDGLDPYRRLLAQAQEKLVPGGVLIMQLRRGALAARREELGRLLGELETFPRAA
jgi:ribosomal protein L11 methylase PrmA